MPVFTRPFGWSKTMFTFNLSELDISKCSTEMLDNLEVEVTWDVLEVLDKASKDKKLASTNGVEEVLFDDEPGYFSPKTSIIEGKVVEVITHPSIDGDVNNPVETYNFKYDTERFFSDNIDALETYLAAAKVFDKAAVKWNNLKQTKLELWNEFQMEMDVPWVAFDRFNTKLDARLETLAREGKVPTAEQWTKAREMRLQLQDKACKFYQNNEGQWKIDVRNPSMTTQRFQYTNGIFQKALEATRACSGFWTTAEGKELNIVSDIRRQAWLTLEENGATQLFQDYNNYLASEVGVSFYDAAEYDEQVVNAQSQNELLEEILSVESGEVSNNGQEVFLDDDGSFDDSSCVNHRIAHPRGFWRAKENFSAGIVIFQKQDETNIASQDKMIDSLCA
jgi:hypothetical protein